MFTFFSNNHLDFDGFGHMSTLEQCFNPEWDDITRRENLGQYNFLFLQMKKSHNLYFSAQATRAGCQVISG